MKDPVRLKDALYNVTQKSGASDEYAKGLIVGTMAGMMATGMTWRQSLVQVAECWPDAASDPRADLMPPSWVDSFNDELRRARAKS